MAAVEVETNTTCSKARTKESMKVPGRGDDACLPHHMVEAFLMDKKSRIFIKSMSYMKSMGDM